MDQRLPPLPPPPSEPPPDASGDQDGCGGSRLERVYGLLGRIDAMYAEATVLLDVALSEGEAERTEGLSTDAALRLLGGRTHGDARMLLAAAEVLRDLPTVARLFDDGTLSWGHVRTLVIRARALRRDARRRLDRALAEQWDAIAGLGPEEVLGLALDIADRVDPTDTDRERDRRAARQFLAFMPDLFGGRVRLRPVRRHRVRHRHRPDRPTRRR